MSIPVIDTFSGAGMGGWTVVNGDITETGGVAIPTTPGTTSTAIFDTAQAETNTDAANGTKGSQVKLTLTGGLEAGSKVRAIINYTDIDNYHFAELEKGGTSVFADLADDRIRLGKRVSGVESWIGESRALLDEQIEYGHMRHYTINTGNTITLMKVLDQYVVKCSVTDPINTTIDDLNEDIIFLHEADGAVSAVTKKVGFQLVGSVHTNSVTQVQAGLFTCHFANKATGNDTTGNGSNTSPYAELNKMGATVLADQVGIFRTGSTYTGNISNEFGDVVRAGTSWEDAPLLMSEASGRINNKCATNRTNIKIKAGSIRYRYTYRMRLQGNSGGVSDVGGRIIQLWGQESSTTTALAHHHRYHELECYEGMNSANIATSPGIFYTGTPPNDVGPTLAQCQTYNHLLDVDSHDGYRSTALGCHGFYLATGSNLIEYCRGYSNRGAGGKFYNDSVEAREVPACGNNILRYSRMYDNVFNGFNTGYVEDNFIHSNLYYGNGSVPNDSNGGGYKVTFGNVNVLIYLNIAYDNFGGGFGVDTAFGQYASDGCQFLHNTSYGNDYGLWLRTGFGNPEPINFVYKNNTCSGNTIDFHEPSANQTNPTYSNNHTDADDSDPFGDTFGDPAFIAPASGDFHLESGSVLRDAGVDVTSVLPVAVDAARRPIPQTAAEIDIGALGFPNPLTNPPTVEIPPTIEATVNVSFNLGLSASDPDGDARELHVTNVTGSVILTAPTPAAGLTIKGGV